MKLFCPGPVMLSKSVKKALSECEIGHRSKLFEELFIKLKKELLSLANASSEYDVVCLSASGSAANEAVIASVFNRNDKILVLSNGVFGNRIKMLMNIYNLDFDVFEVPYGNNFNTEEIEKLLKTNKYSYLFFTHHETSCGMINDIKRISLLCYKFNVKVFIDAVSSFGCEDIDLTNDNIDIMTSVSGKCIGSTPGVSYVFIKKTIYQNLNKQVSNSYLDLSKYYKFSINKNQTPNTPNVSAFNALSSALEEYKDEFKGKRYLVLSNYIRDELETLGVEFLIPRELMSRCVTSIVASKEVYLKLYENGFVTYLGDSNYFNKPVLQICTMGNLTMDDCKDFIKSFKEIYTK